MIPVLGILRNSCQTPLQRCNPVLTGVCVLRVCPLHYAGPTESCYRTSLINDSVYTHFSALNQTGFGSGSAVKTPQHQTERLGKRHITSHSPQFPMRPHGKPVAQRARFRGTGQSGLRDGHVTCHRLQLGN